MLHDCFSVLQMLIRYRQETKAIYHLNWRIFVAVLLTFAKCRFAIVTEVFLIRFGEQEVVKKI